MGSYYFIEDPESDSRLTPVPEDEYIQVIIRIAKKSGIEITDQMILKELKNQNKRLDLKKKYD